MTKGIGLDLPTEDHWGPFDVPHGGCASGRWYEGFGVAVLDEGACQGYGYRNGAAPCEGMATTMATTAWPA